jgi:hypothetical protein
MDAGHEHDRYHQLAITVYATPSWGVAQYS